MRGFFYPNDLSFQKESCGVKDMFNALIGRPLHKLFACPAATPCQSVRGWQDAFAHPFVDSRLRSVQ